MYSNIVLERFNNPKNAGRISKPDGIASLSNEDNTANVEFSLRIESNNITLCKFRAQANPYIVAICSTITEMVVGKTIGMFFLDPISVKKQLGDESDIDIMFCIDCLRMAVEDFQEKQEKLTRPKRKRASKSGDAGLESDEIDEADQPVDEDESNEPDTSAEGSKADTKSTAFRFFEDDLFD